MIYYGKTLSSSRPKLTGVQHILYNYRGVSRYHFPMYLKEIEYRYNHRKENVFKLFLQLYFGYVSP